MLFFSKQYFLLLFAAPMKNIKNTSDLLWALQSLSLRRKRFSAIFVLLALQINAQISVSNGAQFYVGEDATIHQESFDDENISSEEKIFVSEGVTIVDLQHNTNTELVSLCNKDKVPIFAAKKEISLKEKNKKNKIAKIEKNQLVKYHFKNVPSSKNIFSNNPTEAFAMIPLFKLEIKLARISPKNSFDKFIHSDKKIVFSSHDDKVASNYHLSSLSVRPPPYCL